MLEFIVQLLSYLILQESDLVLDPFYLLVSTLVYTIGLIFSIGISYKLFKAMHATEANKALVEPIFLMGLTFIVTFTFHLVAQLLRLISVGIVTLNPAVNIFIPYIIRFAASLFVLTTLVKVPKFRQARFQLVKRLLIFAILFSIIIIGVIYSPFYVGKTPAGMATFMITIMVFTVTNIVTFGLIILMLRREGIDNSSKIGRLRIRMITYGFLGILLTFFLGPILSIPDATGIMAMVVFAGLIMYVGLLIITAYAFYIAFFLPKWLRKRAGLYFDPSIFKVTTKTVPT
ncbi:MAG: hypothetical protein ACFFCZ_19545 [Promethearchaeota archaeon]